MQDYRVDKEKDQKYILSVNLVTQDNKEFYMVKFPGRRNFKHLVKCDENIKKIIDAQEKQAAAGVNNKGFFMSKRIQSGIAAIGGAVGTGAITSVVASGLTSLTATQPSPLVAPISIGILTVLGALPGVVHLAKNHRKVTELNKIEYLNTHKEDLKNFESYPNSLAGLSREKKQMIRESEYPFSITDIEEYSIEELETIVSNIEIEKEYGFKYDTNAPQKNKK